MDSVRGSDPEVPGGRAVRKVRAVWAVLGGPEVPVVLEALLADPVVQAAARVSDRVDVAVRVVDLAASVVGLPAVSVVDLPVDSVAAGDAAALKAAGADLPANAETRARRAKRRTPNASAAATWCSVIAPDAGSNRSAGCSDSLSITRCSTLGSIRSPDRP